MSSPINVMKSHDFTLLGHEKSWKIDISKKRIIQIHVFLNHRNSKLILLLL